MLSINVSAWDVDMPDDVAKIIAQSVEQHLRDKISDFYGRNNIDRDTQTDSSVEYEERF